MLGEDGMGQIFASCVKITRNLPNIYLYAVRLPGRFGTLSSLNFDQNFGVLEILIYAVSSGTESVDLIFLSQLLYRGQFGM